MCNMSNMYWPSDHCQLPIGCLMVVASGCRRHLTPKPFSSRRSANSKQQNRAPSTQLSGELWNRRNVWNSLIKIFHISTHLNCIFRQAACCAQHCKQHQVGPCGRRQPSCDRVPSGSKPCTGGSANSAQLQAYAQAWTFGWVNCCTQRCFLAGSDQSSQYFSSATNRI